MVELPIYIYIYIYIYTTQIVPVVKNGQARYPANQNCVSGASLITVYE
jgi:hypothetical protein